MTFEITHTDGNARVGKFTTKSGVIETPFFMPVVTKATGKYITAYDYTKLGKNVRAKAVICNSLLLSLRPGTKIIKKAGGIHKFMNFDGVVFTDCGGFQSSSTFFELKSKKGLHFRSPYDNKKVILTPKSIMKIQWDIDSDIAMMLDDMTAYGVSEEEARIAMENTHRWGKESLKEHSELRTANGVQKPSERQLLFGILQGNFYPKIREESAKFISSLDFDGIAIGGVAIGEPSKYMYEAVDAALPFVPLNKPRYVMGLGSPLDLLEMINRGIDCFDSIYPTQNARHSSIFTWSGKIYVDKGIYADDFSAIEEGCGCSTCLNYTKAYLHHLTKIQEPAVKLLKSIHNQYFLQVMVEKAKEAIKKGEYSAFLTKMRLAYSKK